MGRYSRGRRGGPAKAVGRETGARVRIPLFPPPFFDVPNAFWCVFSCNEIVGWVIENLRSWA